MVRPSAAVNYIPDLRYMSADTHGIFKAIVLGGMYQERGMLSMASFVSDEEADVIHGYLISMAHRVLEEDEASVDKEDQ